MEDVTGPPMLLQSLKAYNATLGLAHVKILEPGIIFPIDWRYTSQDWKNAGVLSTLDTAPTSGKSCLEVLHVWGPRSALLYALWTALLFADPTIRSCIP